MLISVIIPTFNSAVYLKSLLESLDSQLMEDFEAVVIDNVSKDSTLELVKEFSDKINIQVISEKDEGIYQAMNKGIKVAKGEWLYFMGADDELFDNKVLTSVSVFLTAANDIVYGDCVWIPEQIIESGEWTPEIFIKANINHQRIFYRRSLFCQYGNFNEKYKVAADHDLNIRFFCNHSVRKKYVPITIARYHSGGFSANKIDNAFWEDWSKTIKEPFKAVLPAKTIYGSLGTYIRYLLKEKQYFKAIGLMGKHFVSTGSLGFQWLIMQNFIRTRR